MLYLHVRAYICIQTCWSKRHFLLRDSLLTCMTDNSTYHAYTTMTTTTTTTTMRSSVCRALLFHRFPRIVHRRQRRVFKEIHTYNHTHLYGYNIIDRGNTKIPNSHAYTNVYISCETTHKTGF